MRECPQEAHPELNGRRLFWVKYSDIEIPDVEVIREGLSRSLLYGNTLSLPSHLAPLLPFRSIATNDACTSTQAWSATKDANGVYSFYPERRGPDDLRECLSSSVLPSRGMIAVADKSGNLAPRRRDGHDPLPPYGESSRGSYADEYDDDDDEDDDEDDEDWDWDWDWDYHEPPPPHPQRRNTFTNDYDHSDLYEDDPEPHLHRGRRRNTFTNDYDHSDMYEDELEPPRQGGRRRNSYSTDYDRRNRFREHAEPPPTRGQRRNSYTSGLNRGAGYWDYPELPRFSGPPRGTQTRYHDPGNRNREIPERPRYRGPPHASNGNRRHGNWDRFAPPGAYSISNRGGRGRYSNATISSRNINPAWPNYALTGRNSRARPRSSRISRFFRSFLNYVTS